MNAERLYGTATQIEFPLIRAGEQNFNDDPPSFATGDVRIVLYTSETGAGSAGDATNLPSHVEKGTFRLVLTNAEITAKRIQVLIIDQSATKEWEDQEINIETYGNASAQHPRDRSTTDAVHIAAIVDDIMTDIVESEGSITLQQAMSLAVAALLGVTSNSGRTFKTPNGNATRIQGTVNSSDERTSITPTPSSR